MANSSSTKNLEAFLNRSAEIPMFKPHKPSLFSLYFDDEIPLGWDWVLGPLTGAIMILGFFLVEFILQVPNDPVQYHTAVIIGLQVLQMQFIF
jgi:hypothetical protein